MAEVLWGIAGVLVALFVLYAAAHSWLIRPIIRRTPLDRHFPWIERVFEGLNGPTRAERRAYREAVDRAIDGDESLLEAWRRGEG